MIAIPFFFQSSDILSSIPTSQPMLLKPTTLKPTTLKPFVTYCQCNSCTQAVWDTVATDAGGSHNCGDRILWLQSALGYSEASACQKVESEFPSLCLCGSMSCATQGPTRLPTSLSTPSLSASPSAKPTVKVRHT